MVAATRQKQGQGADSKSNAKEASPSSKRPAKRKPDMAAASKFSTAATPAKSAKAAKSSQVNGDKEAVAQVQNEDQEAQVDKDWSQFYLMKNEPDDFSVDDLACEPDQTTCWEGVRNFRARNIMRAMQPGQRCFFYHSNCKTPGVAGIMEVARAAYADHTQFDKASKYYDAKSTQDAPRWLMVDVKLVRKLSRLISLEELKGLRGGNATIAGMQLFTTARLSIQNVTQEQWEAVLALEDETAPL